MKKAMNILFSVVAMFAFVQIFAACNSGSSGTNLAVPAGSCGAGLAYTTYGCLATTNCVGAQAGYGYYPTTNSCVAPISVTGTSLVAGSAGTWVGALSAINSSAFGQLLASTGQCQTSLAFGSYKCGNYTSTGSIQLVYSGSNFVYAVITAGTSNPAYNYLMGVSGGYGGISVTSNLTFAASGNGVVMYGTTGYGQLTISDTNESFANSAMNLTLNFNGQSLANAQVIRR